MYKKAIVFLLVLSSAAVQAQLSHIGISGGLTLSKQIWKDKLLDDKFKGANKLGFNGGLYTEWGWNEVFTFVSELHYNRLGENERREGVYFAPPTATQLVSWNNFAKFRLNGFDGSPYVLVGPRLGYIFSASPGNLGPLFLAGSGAIGYELYIKDPWIPFIEVHHGRGILPVYSDDFIKVTDRFWEIRIGIKFRRKSLGSYDNCPPVYTLLNR